MIGILLKYKGLVLAVVLFATIGAEYCYITVIKSEMDLLVVEKASLTTMLTESQANLKQLQGDIQTQNTAIDALKTEGDARLVKHAAEVKAAQDTAKTYKQKAEDLLARQAATNIPKCDSANDLINEEIKNAHK